MWISGRLSDSSSPFWYKRGQLAHDGVVGGALEVHAAQQFEARFAQRPAAEVTVDVIADGAQLVLRDRLAQHHHAIAHHAVARDQNHEDAAVGERQQLNLVEHLSAGGHGGGDSDVLRQLGEDVRGALDARLHGFDFAHLGAHALRGGRRHAARDQRPDIEPECLLGRQAAGRGVGLRQIALIRQVRHGVPDGGGTQPVPAPLRDSPRSDRFSGLDIGPDDGIQDFLSSTGQRFVSWHFSY